MTSHLRSLYVRSFGFALAALLCLPTASLRGASKDAALLPVLAPERVADFLHAIIEADRSFYTSQVVNRMQERGIIRATEHWENDGTLPLPAQFLQHSGQMVAEQGSGIRFRLIGLYPINQKNSPATSFERKALESFSSAPLEPTRGVVASGKKRYFQAIYPDRAISAACVSCHNQHPLSPKRDFKLNDIVGAIAITIPLE
ncbi:hypothetical protein YTPLAS18_30450 [Nitrospira sp.]|nr:hypothetical protein YTPLAS18_30450 [Nitrospira sp.]